MVGTLKLMLNTSAEKAILVIDNIFTHLNEFVIKFAILEHNSRLLLKLDEEKQ